MCQAGPQHFPSPPSDLSSHADGEAMPMGTQGLKQIKIKDAGAMQLRCGTGYWYWFAPLPQKTSNMKAQEAFQFNSVDLNTRSVS